MTARLTNNKLFVLLALAAAVLMAWGIASSAMGGSGVAPATTPGNFGNFNVKGFVSYAIHDADGNLVVESASPNTITADGLAALATYIGTTTIDSIVITASTPANFDNTTVATSLGSGWDGSQFTLTSQFTHNNAGTTTISLIELVDTTPDPDLVFATQDNGGTPWSITGENSTITFNWTITISDN